MHGHMFRKWNEQLMHGHMCFENGFVLYKSTFIIVFSQSLFAPRRYVNSVSEPASALGADLALLLQCPALILLP